jgi:hypothetical protein
MAANMKNPRKGRHPFFPGVFAYHINPNHKMRQNQGYPISNLEDSSNFQDFDPKDIRIAVSEIMNPLESG